VQKVNGTAENQTNQFPGALLSVSVATSWTLLQLTFACSASGASLVNLTDSYGVVGSGFTTHTWISGASLTDLTGGPDVTASQPIVYTATVRQ
jgi:hypothetical protein